MVGISLYVGYNAATGYHREVHKNMDLALGSSVILLVAVSVLFIVFIVPYAYAWIPATNPPIPATPSWAKEPGPVTQQQLTDACGVMPNGHINKTIMSLPINTYQSIPDPGSTPVDVWNSWCEYCIPTSMTYSLLYCSLIEGPIFEGQPNIATEPFPASVIWQWLDLWEPLDSGGGPSPTPDESLSVRISLVEFLVFVLIGYGGLAFMGYHAIKGTKFKTPLGFILLMPSLIALLILTSVHGDIEVNNEAITETWAGGGATYTTLHTLGLSAYLLAYMAFIWAIMLILFIIGGIIKWWTEVFR